MGKIKLYVAKTEQKRFRDIFNFLLKSKSKAYISQAGIDFINEKGSGSISSEMFVLYKVNGKKRLTILDNPKEAGQYMKRWKVAQNGFFEILL